MDGLIILGALGRPIVQTRFRSAQPAYPLVMVDHLNHALANSNSERNVSPVLAVDAAVGIDDADTDTDDQTELNTDSDELSENVWRDQAPHHDEELDEGGAVVCHIKVGELRFLCPVSRDGTYLRHAAHASRSASSYHLFAQGRGCAARVLGWLTRSISPYRGSCV